MCHPIYLSILLCVPPFTCSPRYVSYHLPGHPVMCHPNCLCTPLSVHSGGGAGSNCTPLCVLPFTCAPHYVFPQLASAPLLCVAPFTFAPCYVFPHLYVHHVMCPLIYLCTLLRVPHFPLHPIVCSPIYLCTPLCVCPFSYAAHYVSAQLLLHPIMCPLRSLGLVVAQPAPGLVFCHPPTPLHWLCSCIGAS